MVQPNVPGNVRNNYQDRRERYNNSNAIQLRVDHHFSKSDNIFLRYTDRRIDQYNPIGDVAYREPDSTNRNWGGGDWRADAFDSNAQFRPGLGGFEPFSEIETRALADWVLAVRPALVINYHSAGGFMPGILNSMTHSSGSAM